LRSNTKFYMAAKLTRLTHKIALHLHLVASGGQSGNFWIHRRKSLNTSCISLCSGCAVDILTGKYFYGFWFFPVRIDSFTSPQITATGVYTGAEYLYGLYTPQCAHAFRAVTISVRSALDTSIRSGSKFFFHTSLKKKKTKKKQNFNLIRHHQLQIRNWGGGAVSMVTITASVLFQGYETEGRNFSYILRQLVPCTCS
jgi:hypothetical protein